MIGRMGKLAESGTERVHMLSPRYLIGRSSICNLVIDTEIVSGEHAMVRWTGDTWTIQDLGSTNGTYVDGRRLPPGERVALAQGSKVGAGRPAPTLILLDDSPPTLSAETSEGQRHFATRGILALPGEDAPQTTIYQGQDHRWILESPTECRLAVDQELVRAGSTLFRLSIPTVLPDTWRLESDELPMHDLALHFHVSRDEDHVQIELHCQGRAVRLPPRAHDYLLLTLARMRIADQKDPAISEGDAGWIHPDDLVRMLRTNENHLNVAVYRARRMFAETKVARAAGLIERRSDSRQLRIGVRKLKVETC
jgi:hypothetical protein